MRKSTTCHELFRKHLDLSRLFLSVTFFFPRGSFGESWRNGIWAAACLCLFATVFTLEEPIAVNYELFTWYCNHPLLSLCLSYWVIARSQLHGYLRPRKIGGYPLQYLFFTPSFEKNFFVQGLEILSQLLESSGQPTAGGYVSH